MNLHPKSHVVKFHILYKCVSFIFLEHHQVFIEAPRFAVQDPVHILLNQRQTGECGCQDFFIINPFSAPHKGLKVHPTTLTFKARRVKNFVAIIYSLDPLFFPNVILSPSLSSKESRVHCYERSSMATGQMKG